MKRIVIDQRALEEALRDVRTVYGSAGALLWNPEERRFQALKLAAPLSAPAAPGGA